MLTWIEKSHINYMKTVLHFVAVLCGLLCLNAYAAGSLKVTITPSQAVSAGAQWRVDGGSWRNSGATVKGLSNTTHTVEFRSVSGWITPTASSVVVTNGNTTALSVAYVQAASLQVTLTPATAQWRVDGGAWQVSGGTVGNLSPGNHVVDYASLDGYSSPAAETVNLVSGQTTTLSRAHIALAQLQISLVPATGQWRVDSGAWQPSGTSLFILPGDHFIEYETIADHEPLPAETVTLTPGQSVAYQRAYTPSGPVFTLIKSFTDAGNEATMINGSDGLLYVATKTGGPSGAGQIFRVGGDGSGFTRIKSFKDLPDDGSVPAALAEGSDGSIYGVTSSGGSGTNNGTLFKVNKDGSGYVVLRSFSVVSQGSSPNALIEGSDGALYGTTSLGGGSSNAGVLFKVNKDGSGFTVLRSMIKSSDGSSLNGVIEGPGGLLYGTAGSGGAGGAGTVFRIQKDGAGFTVLKALGGTAGSAPKARLLLGGDGLLYGTATSGGSAARGVVFRLNADGSDFVVVHDFADNTTDGSRPESPVSEGPDGMLYGTTAVFGPSLRGTLFKMNKDGSDYTVLKAFGGTVSEGGWPRGAIAVTADGTLYGANVFSGGDSRGIVFRLKSDGSDFAKVVDLGAPEGALPLSPVTEASDGALYGTTYIGGGDGAGVVYKVNKDGSGYAVLHRFQANSNPHPFNRVIEASDGFLYGVSSSPGGITPEGILYRLNKDGSGFSVLHQFGFSTEGASPQGVIEASDGVLYGTTSSGGLSGNGTIFRINKDGSGLVFLRSFAGGAADGRYPYASVTEAADGFLYGTTTSGGAANFGTVFKIAKDGTGYAVLHHFAGAATDGATPYAGVFEASDGRLYGTTTVGGAANFGTVFGLNTDGSGYTVLKSFFGGTTDAASPYYIGVTEKDGVLWGTTNEGGAFSGGTVYKINREGTGFEIVVNFGMDMNDGRVPAAGVIHASDGYLYGTTAYGAGGGGVFRLRAE